MATDGRTVLKLNYFCDCMTINLLFVIKHFYFFFCITIAAYLFREVLVSTETLEPKALRSVDFRNVKNLKNWIFMFCGTNFALKNTAIFCPVDFSVHCRYCAISDYRKFDFLFREHLALLDHLEFQAQGAHRYDF